MNNLHCEMQAHARVWVCEENKLEKKTTVKDAY